MNNNDEFMTILRQTPSATFSAQLYQRLRWQEQRHNTWLHRLTLSAAALLVTFSLAFFALPEVRAQVEEFIQRITVYTFGDVEMVQVRGVIGGSPGVPVPRDDLSLRQAQALLPFTMPTWLPDGFTRQQDIRVVHYSDTETGIGVNWTHEDGRSFTLSVMNNPRPQPVVGLSHAGREVTLGERVGLVYTGSWGPDGKFGGDQVNVVWAQDSLSYYLHSSDIPEEVLIHIAESFRETTGGLTTPEP